jgi:hypothetical protein
MWPLWKIRNGWTKDFATVVYRTGGIYIEAICSTCTFWLVLWLHVLWLQDHSSPDNSPPRIIRPQKMKNCRIYIDMYNMYKAKDLERWVFISWMSRVVHFSRFFSNRGDPVSVLNEQSGTFFQVFFRPWGPCKCNVSIRQVPDSWTRPNDSLLSPSPTLEGNESRFGSLWSTLSVMCPLGKFLIHGHCPNDSLLSPSPTLEGNEFRFGSLCSTLSVMCPLGKFLIHGHCPNDSLLSPSPTWEENESRFGSLLIHGHCPNDSLLSPSPTWEENESRFGSLCSTFLNLKSLILGKF